METYKGTFQWEKLYELLKSFSPLTNLPIELCPICRTKYLNEDNMGIKIGICSPCYVDFFEDTG